MAKSGIKYHVVDSFADSPLKGNPAAVCLLNEERDEKWMQAVGREFNLSATCFVTEILSGDDAKGDGPPKYRLRLYAPDAEMIICGHGTLASAYVLFATGKVKSKEIEFHTQSGLMKAERVPCSTSSPASPTEKKSSDDENGGSAVEVISVRLTFPLVSVVPCDDPLELKMVPPSVKVADNTVSIVKMGYENELLVELSSAEHVMQLQPSIDEVRKWPGRGVVVTGAAPPGSGYDFYSRFFCPRLGMSEDPVCGSVHCALAPYWSKKLGKKTFKAYMASPRGGGLELFVDDERQKVLIQGKVAPVMEGLLFA